MVTSGGSTNTLTHTLMNLQNGDTYTISIVATSSSDLPSESILADMTVGLSESNIIIIFNDTTYMIYTVPDPPVITVDSTTATSIIISGGVPSDSVADSYEVIWVRDITVGCSNEDEGMTTSVGEIANLQEHSNYTITVTAFNSAGNSETSVTAMTMEAGER